MTPGISSGWRAPRSSSRPSGDSTGATPEMSCANRTLAWIDVELGCRVDGLSKLDRLEPERVGQVPQNAMHLFALLLLERHDLVVDLDRAERLEIEAGAAAGAAVNDAGNRRAMLGLDDEHVAAVAVADDLILQIARGVLAAQIRFERRSQTRPLLAQLRAQIRDSSGLALSLTSPDGSILLRTSAIWFLNDPQFSASAFSVGKGPLTRRIVAHVSASESRNSANASSRSGSSARPSTASAESTVSRSAGAFSENAGFASRYFTPSAGCAEQLRGAVRIGLRLELGEAGRAERRQREPAHDVDDGVPL